ncbi:MAG: hypothetical protein MI746_10175, partial [Pseudomonadales bacterium]|nr:hypothetical protein [Pseudomonadales bacterium]
MNTRSLLTFLCLLSICCENTAQVPRLSAVTDALLQSPPPESWLNWRGGPEAWGYSPLNQINRDNVSELR